VISSTAFWTPCLTLVLMACWLCQRRVGLLPVLLRHGFLLRRGVLCLETFQSLGAGLRTWLVGRVVSRLFAFEKKWFLMAYSRDVCTVMRSLDRYPVGVRQRYRSARYCDGRCGRGCIALCCIRHWGPWSRRSWSLPSGGPKFTKGLVCLDKGV
jgi:hypothetical protein